MKKKQLEISMDYDFELSDLITQVRLEKGLTQEALALLIGTKQSAISRAEAGNPPPGRMLLLKIAEALNICLLPPRWKGLKTPPIN